jgi:hypothetical protein
VSYESLAKQAVMGLDGWDWYEGGRE